MSTTSSSMSILRSLLQGDARFPFTFYFINHPAFDEDTQIHLSFRWKHSDYCRIHALLIDGVRNLMDSHASLFSVATIKALFPENLETPPADITRADDPDVAFAWRPTTTLFRTLREWHDAAAVAETSCALEDGGYISRDLRRARIEMYRLRLSRLLAIEDYIPFQREVLSPREAVVCASLMVSILESRATPPDKQWKRMAIETACSPPYPYCSCPALIGPSPEVSACDSE